ANHRHRLAVAQAKVQESGVAAVEKTKPVTARLDIQIRPHFAVDDGYIGKPLRNPVGMDIGPNTRRGITQRSVGAECAILDDHRNFLWAAGQTELLFVGISHDVEAGQSGINVEASDAESMVMVPERLRA